MLLEICAASPGSALQAQAGGANRIELCTALPVGGLTPSHGCMEWVRKQLQIDVFVLIRPREGDFCYSDFEIECMKSDIRFCREIGMNGVVIGVLHPDESIHMERMAELIALARPMEVTCHRAFDFVKKPDETLEQLIELGVDRLLTSGQHPSVVQGADLVADLIRQSNGRIKVMPGCGINPSNIAALARKTGATEFHLTAGRYMESAIKDRSPLSLNAPGLREYDFYETDAAIVREVVAALANQ